MQNHSCRSIFLFILLTLSVIVIGCNDDDCPVNPPAETGSVLVTIDPDTIAASWTLTLPGGLIAVGVGDSLLTEMPVGNYSMAWDSVGPWHPAPSATVTPPPLAAGDTLVFAGLYEFIEEPAGVVEIRIEPSWLDAPWVLSGPNDFITDGTHGSLDWGNLEGGDYTIAWGAVDGWLTPPGETLALAEGGTITFTGVYTEDPALTGTVRVDMEPEDLAVDWTVAGPDGFVATGSGDAVLENVEPGDYHIIWGEAPFWISPGNQMQSLVAGDTVTFAGTYEVDLVGPDDVVTAFVNGQVTSAADLFPELVDSAFRLNLLQETIDDWAGGSNPLNSSYFDRDVFTSIYANIFAGEAGEDANGNVVPPVLVIEYDLMEKLAPWEPVDPEMEYFGQIQGAFTTQYNVVINFYLPGNSRFQVTGGLGFVVKATDAGYRLLGLMPMGRDGKATESVTYDGVLALYR